MAADSPPRMYPRALPRSGGATQGPVRRAFCSMRASASYPSVSPPRVRAARVWVMPTVRVLRRRPAACGGTRCGAAQQDGAPPSGARSPPFPPTTAPSHVCSAPSHIVRIHVRICPHQDKIRCVYAVFIPSSGGRYATPLLMATPGRDRGDTASRPVWRRWLHASSILRGAAPPHQLANVSIAQDAPGTAGGGGATNGHPCSPLRQTLPWSPPCPQSRFPRPVCASCSDTGPIGIDAAAAWNMRPHHPRYPSPPSPFLDPLP